MDYREYSEKVESLCTGLFLEDPSPEKATIRREPKEKATGWPGRLGAPLPWGELDQDYSL